MDGTVKKIGTIRQTVEHLHAEGYGISENALRFWVKSGQIKAKFVGRKAYINYDAVISFLTDEGEAC